MRVQVVRAWPRRHLLREVELADGAALADAVAASGIDVAGVSGYAVFGERAGADAPLQEGDRVELLAPLQADPKQARRRRADGQRTGKGTGGGSR